MTSPQTYCHTSYPNTKWVVYNIVQVQTFMLKICSKKVSSQGTKKEKEKKREI